MQYKAHVCRQMFGEDGALESWEQGRRKEVESSWPEYREKTQLLEVPAYMGDAPLTQSLKARLERGQAWLGHYLQRHVQRLQELKQHHVHIWDDEKKEYKVLEHCKSKDKKNECKSHFQEPSG